MSDAHLETAGKHAMYLSYCEWYMGRGVKVVGRDAGCVTVTLAVALAMFGALAVMVTAPAATPVTSTDTPVVPVPKLTVAGTVGTAALLELRLTTSPAGAGADRFSVRFCAAAPFMVRLP